MKKQIEKAVSAERKVIIYKSIVKDKLVQKCLFLLKEVLNEDADLEELLSLYNDFTAEFIPLAADISIDGKHAWENYLLQLILADENIFTRQAELHELKDIPAQITKLAVSDLRCLNALALFSAGLMREVLAGKAGVGKEMLDEIPDWEGICLYGKKNINQDKFKVYKQFYSAASWADCLKELCSYYRTNGVGIFGQNYAFRWISKNGDGELVGVRNIDSIQMGQLYEYEREQAKIIQNTEQFLRGYPANNVLLYGDRGTGKSSTVKALVNLFGKEGLRLIEIQKQDVSDFPEIIARLSDRPQKFILFIDDLSFTEQEGQYRELKAILEGGVEARPRNVLIYATSNRRHLVQETFSDREYTLENEDVRRMDTQQEKLSLADRFGITVTFAAPDQKRYLAIVEKLVEERGLKIPLEELHQRALKWELSFNTRSGRTARQFVDFLEGQLALERE